MYLEHFPNYSGNIFQLLWDHSHDFINVIFRLDRKVPEEH